MNRPLTVCRFWLSFGHNSQSHPAAGGRLLRVCLDRARCDSGLRPGRLRPSPQLGVWGHPRDRGVASTRSVSVHRIAGGWGCPSLAMDLLADPSRLFLRRVAPSSLRAAARRNDPRQRTHLVRGDAGCDRSRPISDRAGDVRWLPKVRRLGRVLTWSGDACTYFR